MLSLHQLNIMIMPSDTDSGACDSTLFCLK